MQMIESQANRGWKFLFNSRKEHYFIGLRSICGKYMTIGQGGCSETSDNTCKACAAKLDQMAAGQWVKDLKRKNPDKP